MAIEVKEQSPTSSSKNISLCQRSVRFVLGGPQRSPLLTTKFAASDLAARSSIRIRSTESRFVYVGGSCVYWHSKPFAYCLHFPEEGAMRVVLYNIFLSI